jgi:hypothetical protein
MGGGAVRVITPACGHIVKASLAGCKVPNFLTFCSRHRQEAVCERKYTFLDFEALNFGTVNIVDNSVPWTEHIITRLV